TMHQREESTMRATMLLMIAGSIYSCNAQTDLAVSTDRSSASGCAEDDIACIDDSAEEDKDFIIDDKNLNLDDGVVLISWSSKLKGGSYIVGLSTKEDCSDIASKVETTNSKAEIELPDLKKTYYLCLYGKNGNSYFKATNSGIKISVAVD